MCPHHLRVLDLRVQLCPVDLCVAPIHLDICSSGVGWGGAWTQQHMDQVSTSRTHTPLPSRRTSWRPAHSVLHQNTYENTGVQKPKPIMQQNWGCCYSQTGTVNKDCPWRLDLTIASRDFVGPLSTAAGVHACVCVLGAGHGWGKTAVSRPRPHSPVRT